MASRMHPPIVPLGRLTRGSITSSGGGSMAERTLRGARLGGQSFEDERGIEFAARQQVGYRCPQGHEFEITMSVEADIPAIWECPRCGAEALSAAASSPRRRPRSRPARTGTCCWSGAPRRSSRTSSPSVSSCSAAARSARRTCTAPRQEAQGDCLIGTDRRTAVDCRSTLSRRRPRPGPRVPLPRSGASCSPGPDPVRPTRRPAARRRRRPRLVSTPRAIGRVNGRISSKPTTSVTKPGVSISVPPIRISAPSASSRAGIRPRLQRLVQGRPRHGGPRA